MNKFVYLLNNVPNGISKLVGGSYRVDSILNAVQTFTQWALTIGITLSGVALIIGFIMYAVSDVDQKARVKQRIIQTLFGVVGIILALSLVNLIIDLLS